MRATKRYSKKALSIIYDRLYRAAEKILKKYSPCNFSNNVCKLNGGCCDLCSHLSKKGCRVKSLACKLWLCYIAKCEFPECDKKLEKLRRIAIQYEFLDEYDEDIGFREPKLKAIQRTCR